MNGHDHPELFDPQTEEEWQHLIAEQEAARDRAYEDGLIDITYTSIDLRDYNRGSVMTPDEYESYLADCDSYENIQEP